MSIAHELNDQLATLARDERRCLAAFLVALAEFDRLKLWRELGYPSLFFYLRKKHRYSAGAAQNRKTAAELIQQVPEVGTALESGELCLSTVCAVAKVLTPENRDALLPRFFGLSRQEAEAVVAAIRPAEVIPTREVVTAVRTSPAVTRTVALPVDAPALLPDDQSGSRGETPRAATPTVSPGEMAPGRATALGTPPALALPPGVALPPPPPPRPAVEPLDAEVARLHLTVPRRLLEKLEAARDALGHAIPTGDAAAIIERGLDLVLAEHAKRQGLVERPQQKRRPSRPDHVPAAVKREVWRRAGGRCEFVLESGERCGCTGRLQYDHIRPTALGGPSTVENVRLVCAAHNLIAARRVFGDAKIDNYARRKPLLLAQAPALSDACPSRSDPR